jgi:hypothetical protein
VTTLPPPDPADHRTADRATFTDEDASRLDALYRLHGMAEVWREDDGVRIILDTRYVVGKTMTAALDEAEKLPVIQPHESEAT